MSNSASRVLVAIAGIPLIIGASLMGGVAFFLIVALIAVFSLIEFYRLTEAKGARPQRIIGILAAVAFSLSFFYPKLQLFCLSLFEAVGVSPPFPTQTQLFLMIILVTLAVVTLVELFRNNGSAILNIGATLFGIFYIGVSLGTFIGLREVFTPLDFPMLRYFAAESSFSDPATVTEVYRWGGYTVIALFACIWICDTAAYYVGLSLGKHKLFPRVSPKKSWEGAIAGFIAAIGVAVASKYLALDYLTVESAIVIGVIVGVFGQLGDLVESLLKRDAGIKDSSSLIPGHGGVFDRFDSLIFVSPLVYLYIDYIVLS